MSEVNATDMLNCIPKCAMRVYNALRTLLWNMRHIGVGRHSIRSPTGFSQDLRSGQVEVEAHVFYYVIENLIK